MKILSKILLLSLSGFAFNASANYMLEPYAGGQFSGQVSGNFNSAASIDSGSFSSLYYGGRLGLDFSGFFIGAEYMADTNMSVKFDGPNGWGAGSTNANLSNTNLGGFIGIEFMNPLAVRLMGTFFAASDGHLMHTDSTGKTDSDQNLSGYGYKGELSTRIAHFLTLGVAYYQIIYTQSKDNLTGISSTMVPVGTQHAVLTQISIPLEF